MAKEWCEACNDSVDEENFCINENKCFSHCECFPCSHNNEVLPKCPYCDYEFTVEDVWHDVAKHTIDLREIGRQEEGNYSAICPSCNHKFEVRTFFDVRFSCEGGEP